MSQKAKKKMSYGNIKQLNSAGAQFAASAAAIYTAPSGKAAEVAALILHNTNTSSETVKLYFRGTAAANRMFQAGLAANETLEFSPKVPLVLQGGEVLGGETTTVSKVNVIVLGREEA